MESNTRGGANINNLFDCLDKKDVPSVDRYLQNKYPLFLKVIDCNGQMALLFPKKGNGITVLVPDEAYTKKLAEMVLASGPDVEASDIIASLILRDRYADVKDFEANRDKIGNMINRKLVIEKIEKNSVKLAGGGVITPDPGFSMMPRVGNSIRGNVAVWNLKGEIDYKNAPALEFNPAIKKNGLKSKKGSAEMARYLGAAEGVSGFIDYIESEEINAFNSFVRAPTAEYLSPMLRCVALTLEAFQARQNEEVYSRYLMHAKSLLTKIPLVDFYLLYRDPLIFHPEIMNTIVDTVRSGMGRTTGNKASIDRFCSTDIAGDKALVLSEAGKAQLATLRAGAITMAGMSAASVGSLATKVESIYNNINNSNSFDGARTYQIYPASLAAIFKGSPRLHLLLDTFSFMVFTNANLAVSKHKGIPNCAEIIGLARTQDFTNVQLSKADVLCLVRSQAKIDPNKAYQHLQYFWNTFGVYVPCQPGSQHFQAYGGAEDDSDEEGPNLSALIDHDFNAYNDSIVEGSGEAVSEYAIREVRDYMRAHEGKLPPALAS